MKTKKELTVQLTLEWTFNETDWSEQKEHLEALKENPKIVLGYDILSTLFTLNDISYPEMKKVKVTPHD
jgi:hypothetical protein